MKRLLFSLTKIGSGVGKMHGVKTRYLPNILLGALVVGLGWGHRISSAQGLIVYAPGQANCETTFEEDLVSTSKGLLSITDFCRQLEKEAANPDSKPTMPIRWQDSQWIGNSICRTREGSGDLACFSADTAKKLRWQLP